MTWLPDLKAPPSMDMQHLDGIVWHDAPIPHRLHRCKPQTTGWSGLNQIKRCACGAIYIQGGWLEKNSRRKSS